MVHQLFKFPIPRFKYGTTWTISGVLDYTVKKFVEIKSCFILNWYWTDITGSSRRGLGSFIFQFFFFTLCYSIFILLAHYSLFLIWKHIDIIYSFVHYNSLYSVNLHPRSHIMFSQCICSCFTRVFRRRRRRWRRHSSDQKHIS